MDRPAEVFHILAPMRRPSSENADCVRPYAICRNSSRLRYRDRITYQVGIQCFQNCFAGKPSLPLLRSESCRNIRWSRPFFITPSDVMLSLQAIPAESAPADSVCITGNVLNFFCLDPFSLFRNRSRTMIRAFRDTNHVFYFFCVLHMTPILLFKVRTSVRNLTLP